jgi:peptide/nickel transport system substrate-binding protein
VRLTPWRLIVCAALLTGTLTAVAASSASAGSGVPGSIGSAPAAAPGAETAGTITWGLPPGEGPYWIFPIVPQDDNTVVNQLTFSWEMWRPVYWTVNGVTPELDQAMSLADRPVFSAGDRTVSITFKRGYKWSDGTPITANDLLFEIDLIKAAVKASPENWSGYTPGGFPGNVASTSEPDASTLVLHLKQRVNPSYLTEDILGQGSVIPLPAQKWARDSAKGPLVTDWNTNPADALKIYNFLSSQSQSNQTYASNPLWQTVDGPYKLAAYNFVTDDFTMVPNPRYGGPHAAKMSRFQGLSFNTQADEFHALQTGALDVASIGIQDVPQLSQLNYHYFGEPAFGFDFAAYNFKDKTGDFGNIAARLYFRQAMAHLEDQNGWIAAFMHGAGDPAYGPVPAYPLSPYLPQDAKTNPYPFSVPAAVTLLKKNGWTIHPGGTDVCAKAGTAVGECGAGIPAGTKLAFSFAYANAPALIGQEATDLAAQASKAGIHITLRANYFNYLIQNYNDPGDPANENKWAVVDYGGLFNSPYPSTYGLFNTTGLEQIGDYSNPTANALIDDSVSGTNPAAVKNEASFLTANQPVLFQPDEDNIWAWKSTLSGPPASFENLTQYFATPEFWYFTG